MCQSFHSLEIGNMMFIIYTYIFISIYMCGIKVKGGLRLIEKIKAFEARTLVGKFSWAW